MDTRVIGWDRERLYFHREGNDWSISVIPATGTMSEPDLVVPPDGGFGSMLQDVSAGAELRRGGGELEVFQPFVSESMVVPGTAGQLSPDGDCVLSHFGDGRPAAYDARSGTPEGNWFKVGETPSAPRSPSRGASCGSSRAPTAPWAVRVPGLAGQPQLVPGRVRTVHPEVRPRRDADLRRDPARPGAHQRGVMRRLVTAAMRLVVSGPLLACTSAGSSAPMARPGSLVVQSDVGLPEPKAGLRWVVADGIAFQVPTDWSDTDLGCEYDLDRPAVVYHASHWFACRHLDVTRFAPSVQVLDADDRQVRTWRRRATVPVPGLDATRSAVVTQGNGKSRAALVLAEAGQLLLVEAATPAGVEAILATFRKAPGGVAGVLDVGLLSGRAARWREVAGYEVEAGERRRVHGRARGRRSRRSANRKRSVRRSPSRSGLESPGSTVDDGRFATEARR